MFPGSVSWGEAAHVPTQWPVSFDALRAAPVRTTMAKARRPDELSRAMRMDMGGLRLLIESESESEIRIKMKIEIKLKIKVKIRIGITSINKRRIRWRSHTSSGSIMRNWKFIARPSP
jgi:hypothetical protein